MKVGCLSDLHLVASQPQCRTDNIADLQWSKLYAMLRKAKVAGCKVVVFAGDITDTARSWYVLPRLTELLSMSWGMRFYAVFGQHDTYMYSESTRERTNLGVLERAGLVKILSGTGVVKGGVRFLGASWGQPIPKPKDGRKKNVLVVHAPIGPAVYPGHETTAAMRFIKTNRMYDLVVCGDIHRSFIKQTRDKRTILNTGPLVRKWADSAIVNHRPHICIWDSRTGKVEKKFIKVPDAAEVISREHIQDRVAGAYTIDNVFIEATMQRSAVVNMNAIIAEVIAQANPSAAVTSLLHEYLSEAYDAR